MVSYVKPNTKGAKNVNTSVTMEENEKELPMYPFNEKETVVQGLNRFTGECSPTFQELGDPLINPKDVYHYLLARHTVGTQPTFKHYCQKQLFPRKESKSLYYIISMVPIAVSNSRPELLNC